MKIVTWNINGIRTPPQPLKTVLDSFEADVICLQETKVTRDLLDDRIALVDGYTAYFSFSRKRSGYSGVVTYCRDTVRPVAAEEGLSGYWSSLSSNKRGDFVGWYGTLGDLPAKELLDLDGEGRAVVTEHLFRGEEGKEENVCIINVYCPRADKQRDDRKAYKLLFCQSLQARAEALVSAGKHVVIVGDLNTSHRPIDTCDSSGADWPLNPLRLWLSDFLYNPTEAPDVDPSTSHHRFFDSYRFLHHDTKHAYTCWSTSTGARANNYGCRIDYVLMDYALAKVGLRSCDILAEVQGSDHCPVVATLEIASFPAEKAPSLCAKYMPEFFGKQQKLSTFFQQKPGEQGRASEVSTTEKRSRDDKEVLKNPVYGSEHPQPKRLCLTEVTVRSVSKTKGKGASGKSPKATGQQRSLKDFFAARSAKSAVDSSVSETESEGSRVSEVTCSQSVVMTANAGVPKHSVTDQRDEVWPDSTVSSSIIIPENERIESGGSGASSQQSELDLSGPTGSSQNSQEVASAWKNILRGPDPVPLCFHKEKCIMKTVNKAGPNRKRAFYMCAKPEGFQGDPNARCRYFKWADGKGNTTTKKKDEDLRP